MTDEEKLQQFTQEVYLTRNGQRIEDITDEEGVEEVARTIIWANLLLDELEKETDPDGMPINWAYVRENEAEIGTIATVTDTFDLPAGALRLVANPDRPLIIRQDGILVSAWDVVDPNQISNRNHYAIRDKRVTYVNQKIVFSRRLDDTEIGGTVYADLVNSFPRLADDDTTLFDLPIPRQLLVLGTAKNSVLPDIVQGGLTPSFVQKYADVLNGEKAANMQSADAVQAVTDDLSGIGGVY